MQEGKQKPGGRKISWFGPLVLFLVLCILIVAVHILRQLRTVPSAPAPLAKPEKEAGKIAEKVGLVSIIIDDVGWNKAVLAEIEQIKQPLNLSLLPYAPYSQEAAKKLQNKGFEFMLHLPLEPVPPAQCLDKGMLSVSMTDTEIVQQFSKDLEKFVPYVKGVNNHMGSLFTCNEEKMAVLLSEVKKRDLFFVDSGTARNSVGYPLAKKLGLPAAKREIFLDNSSDPESIRNQLRRTLKLAQQNGRVIAIGHARPSTLQVLKEELPEMEKQGVKFVPVSQQLEH